MTTLKKRLKRVVRIDQRKTILVPEQIVLSIYPGGTLGLREQFSRKELFIGLGDVYLLAGRLEGNRVAAERKEKRRARG